jgi:hypothetical protein
LGGDARPEHGLASEREGQRHALTTSTDERGPQIAMPERDSGSLRVSRGLLRMAADTCPA